MLPVLLNGQRPIDLEDPLFVRLVNCATPAERAALVERFGWRDGAGDPTDAEIDELARHLELVAEFLLDPLGASLGDEAGAQELREAGPEILRIMLEDVAAKPRFRERGGTKRFVFEVTTLTDFTVLEVAAAVEAKASGRRCEHCNNMFLYGPLTGRRSHGKYCGDRCRVAAMRVRKADQEGDL